MAPLEGSLGQNIGGYLNVRRSEIASGLPSNRHFNRSVCRGIDLCKRKQLYQTLTSRQIQFQGIYFSRAQSTQYATAKKPFEAQHCFMFVKYFN